jgi:hypothetical protein
MTARGLDASGPLWQFALVLLLPFVFARFVHWRVPVRARGRSIRADEAILLPAALSLAFALLDLIPRWSFTVCLLAAAAIVIALRLAIHRMTKLRRPALAFSLAPLALLAQMQWIPVSRAAILALVWVVVTPLVLSVLRPPERALRAVVSLVVFPVVVFAYPLTLLGIQSAPHVDFFEDEHPLVPASEMLRGELPYRDVVPVHGLLSDGGLDLAMMSAGDDTIGELLTTRRVVASLNLVAIYAVGFAATGSAGLGLLGALAGISLFPAATIWLRTIPALFALAAACFAVRLRSPRRLRIAGGLLVLAFLMGMEFAVYSGIVTLAVALMLRPRGKALAQLAAGVAAVALPIAVAFAALGFLGPFVRVTLGELLPAGKVYVPGPLELPQTLSAALWGLALLLTAAALRRLQRTDAIWMIGLWIAVAGLSFAQRRHAYYEFAIGAFLVVLTALVSRRNRIAAAVLAVLVIVIVRPDKHLLQVAAPLRAAHGVPEGDGVRLDDIPRARGAVFRPEAAQGVRSARTFVATLHPNQTFYDFSNSGLLYFLLDRDAPARHQHIPFVEPERFQEEIAAQLATDPSIAAVLLACPGGNSAIDGVTNRDRAPLVWQSIERHFAPGFEENGVVFWRRK